MSSNPGILQRRVVPALTALSENTYLSAIRAGMVSVVPLTIIGGLFMIVSYLPVPGWEARIAACTLLSSGKRRLFGVGCEFTSWSETARERLIAALVPLTQPK